MELSCWCFQVKHAFWNCNLISWMGRGGRSLVLALGQGQLLGEEGAGSLQNQDGRPPRCFCLRESGIKWNELPWEVVTSLSIEVSKWRWTAMSPITLALQWLETIIFIYFFCIASLVVNSDGGTVRIPCLSSMVPETSAWGLVDKGTGITWGFDWG